MTLEELVYQIDGSLQIGPKDLLIDGEATCVVSLHDRTGTPAIIRIYSADKPREEIEATMTGPTEKAAKEKLVEALQGHILMHRWPIQDSSYYAHLRVPPTLIGTVPDPKPEGPLPPHCLENQ